MKTNKGNENKNKNNEMKASIWGLIPATPWKRLDLNSFNPPLAGLDELVVAGRALVARVTEAGGMPGEVAASGRLGAACDLGAKALTHNRRAALGSEADEEAGARPAKLAKLATTAVGMLDLRAASGVAAIASGAAWTKKETFGVDFEPTQMTTRALYHRVGEVEAMLRDDANLRLRLEGHVPQELLAELFAARAALGTRWAASGEAEAPPLDLRKVSEFVRQCMAEYAVNVLATVDVQKPETVARATGRLAPLTQLRREVNRKRRIKEEEEEVVAESDGGATTPTPAPATPLTPPQ